MNPKKLPKQNEDSESFCDSITFKIPTLVWSAIVMISTVKIGISNIIES